MKINKWDIIAIMGSITGLITGFSFILLSQFLTLKIYEFFKIIKPVCNNDFFNCAYSALFDVSLFILGVLGVIILAIGIKLFLRKVEDDATEEECKYCNKKLGQEYRDGKCMWQEKEKTGLWAHERCIPKNELPLWTSTEI